MSCPLANERVWSEKAMQDDAERRYYEQLARSKAPLTPLADEVAKARQRLIEVKDTFDKDVPAVGNNEQVRTLESKVAQLNDIVLALQSTVRALENRLSSLEGRCVQQRNPVVPVLPECTRPAPSIPMNVNTQNAPTSRNTESDDDDDDVDLFGSDSDNEESSEAAKVREERLAAYAAKKSKKPALIAKSNIILDVKPWDDETDMKAMEAEVRKIEKDGLLLGAAKLVPLAYGIHKLQISCVIEDDKVSVDWLQEQIEAIEDYVQSVDIAAFNKI